jgi:hypothetical protein
VPKRWHDAPGSERAQDAAQAGNGGRQAHCERAESDHMHQEHDDERPKPVSARFAVVLLGRACQ